MEFPGDLTVIKGPNEQGKSTVVSALVAGLFYDPKKENESIKELKSWNSEELYTIRMTFEEEGSEWELVKDFQKREMTLVDKGNNKRFNTYKEISQLLYRMGGYRSADLFHSTACVKQDMVNDIGSGKKAIEEALQDLVTSGADNVNVLTIIKKLDREILQLERGLDHLAKNPGTIRLLQDSLNAKREEYSKLLQQVKELKSNTERFNKVKSEQEKLNDDLILKQKELEGVTSYFTVMDEIKRNTKELEKLEDILDRIEEVEKESARLDREIQLATSNPAEYHNSSSSSQLFLIAAVILLVIGVIGIFTLKLLLVVLPVGILLGWKGFSVRAQKNISTDPSSGILETLRKDKDKNLWILQGILGKKEKGDIMEERKKILRLIDTQEGKIEKAYQQDPPTAKISIVLEREITALLKRKEELEKEKIRLESVIASQKDDQEEFFKLEEAAEDLTQQLEYEKNKLEVYRATKEILIEVKESTVAALKERLKSYMNAFIFEITHNRYNRVELDNDLNMSVYSEQKGDYVEVGKNLSRGTIDQCYLVSRFAMLEILSPHKRPLIILDDPFVNFDQTRRIHARHICQDLAKKFQILLFTHSDGYDDWGKVITLAA